MTESQAVSVLVYQEYMNPLLEALRSQGQPKAATAAILFPTIIADATAAVIEIRDAVRAGALGYVALRPVPLGELLEAVRVDGDPDRRVRLAKRLAFGTTQELVRSELPGELAGGDSQFGALTVVQ